GPLRMPALPRTQAAASRLHQLRVLPRSPGQGGRRGVRVLWIAVDAMGGDFAPAPAVEGAIAATRHFDLGVLLVGRAKAIGAELARRLDVDPDRVRIVDAPDVV